MNGLFGFGELVLRFSVLTGFRSLFAFLPRISGAVVVGCELEAKSQVVYPVRVEGSKKGVWVVGYQVSGIRYQVSGIGCGWWLQRR